MADLPPPTHAPPPDDPRTAAEELRRILAESARRKFARGDGMRRQISDGNGVATAFDVLALNAALDRLAVASPRRAALVQLRYFGGLTNSQAAEVLGVPLATAEADWAYARAWLKRELGKA